MNLYRIRDWNTRYENAQSRRCKELHWIPVPARHDSERYGEMMSRPDAAEIFSVWIMCLQVGARSEPRGSLVRSDGTPHTPTTLAVKTRGHEKWFEKALPFLSQIGWLECVTIKSEETRSGIGADPECDPSRVRMEGKGMEGKGMEGKGMEGKELNGKNGTYPPESRVALFFLNEQSGRSFRETADNLGFITARLKEEGVNIEGVKKMILRQCSLWKGTSQAEYLRPQTLFNATKFDAYYAAKDVPIQTSLPMQKPESKQIQETINVPTL